MVYCTDIKNFALHRIVVRGFQKYFNISYILSINQEGTNQSSKLSTE